MSPALVTRRWRKLLGRKLGGLTGHACLAQESLGNTLAVDIAPIAKASPLATCPQARLIYNQSGITISTPALKQPAEYKISLCSCRSSPSLISCHMLSPHYHVNQFKYRARGHHGFPRALVLIVTSVERWSLLELARG